MENLYSTVNATVAVTDGNDGKYFDAGIHEDVTLTGVRAEESPTSGQFFIEFKFEKGDKVVTHTEWESKQLPSETNEAYFEKVKRQLSRFKQIFVCFYDEKMFNYQATSFADFCKWMALMLNNADKSKLVRIKFVYNDRGYLQLPKYAKFRFIEPMSTEVPMVRELAMDVFKRPVVADVEKKDVNPYSVMSTTQDATVSDDLPF